MPSKQDIIALSNENGNGIFLNMIYYYYLIIKNYFAIYLILF